MILSPEGEALIKRFEACRLEAYLDTGGVATIGWGTTKYPDGRRVAMGDTCTQGQADEWFRFDIAGVVADVDRLTIDAVLQRQADSLVSFTYNVGTSAYRGSTLRRKVNEDPHRPAIRAQFMRWHFDNGKPVKGLWKRRHQEADTYFGVTTPIPPMPL